MDYHYERDILKTRQYENIHSSDWVSLEWVSGIPVPIIHPWSPHRNEWE